MLPGFTLSNCMIWVLGVMHTDEDQMHRASRLPWQQTAWAHQHLHGYVWSSPEHGHHRQRIAVVYRALVCPTAGHPDAAKGMCGGQQDRRQPGKHLLVTQGTQQDLKTSGHQCNVQESGWVSLLVLLSYSLGTAFQEGGPGFSKSWVCSR